MLLQKLLEKGIRLTLEAEEEIKNVSDEKLILDVIALNKPFVTKEDLDSLREKEQNEDFNKKRTCSGSEK